MISSAVRWTIARLRPPLRSCPRLVPPCYEVCAPCSVRMNVVSTTIRSAPTRSANAPPDSSDLGPQELSTSLVEPHLLHAAPTVDGLVRNQVLHMRPDSVVVKPPAQHGADRRLLELSLDRVNQREALGRLQFLRLLIDQSRDLLVAVAGIVAR